MSLGEVLLGRRLSNREAESRKICTLEGVPAFGRRWRVRVENHTASVEPITENRR